MSGTSCRVVGIFEDAGSEGENGVLYMPISTAQLAFGRSDVIDRLVFTTGDANLEETQAMANQVLELMAAKYHFSKDDPRAMRIRNNFEQYNRISKTIDLLKTFSWLIGHTHHFCRHHWCKQYHADNGSRKEPRKLAYVNPLGQHHFLWSPSLFKNLLSSRVSLDISDCFSAWLCWNSLLSFLPSTGAVFSNPTVDFKTAHHCAYYPNRSRWTGLVGTIHESSEY